MANIKPITAGKKVSEFTQDLKDNFDALNDELLTKQSIIYVMKAGQSENTITIGADGSPSGGSDGDIVIVYEEE